MNTQTDTTTDNAQGGDAKQAAPTTASVSDAAAAFAAAPLDATTVTAAASDEPEFDQRKAVNDGRLKKMSDENRQLKEQLEELKRQVAEAQAKAGAESFDSLPEMADFDESTRKAIYAGANKIVEEKMRALGGDIEALKRERAAQAAATRQTAADRAQTEAFEMMEKTHPGLLARLGQGDLAGAWHSFLRESDDYAGRTYGEIVQSALARGNGSTLVKVAKEFVRSRGIAGQYNPPTGGPRAAAAEAVPAGTDADGRKVWPSKQAILDAMDKVQVDERRGMISAADRRKKLEALEDDFRAGRYIK